MKTEEELLREKEELLKKLNDKEIEGIEYNKKKNELDDQLKMIKDNDSIGKNIKIIKICVIVIAAIMSLFTVIIAVSWISSMVEYGDYYDSWGEGESVEYDGDVDDLEGVEF